MIFKLLCRVTLIIIIYLWIHFNKNFYLPQSIMSPSTAIAYQYANSSNDPSSSSGGAGGGGGFSSEWNNMDGGLDFDLLAEYLLEDVNAGGFDFR